MDILSASQQSKKKLSSWHQVVQLVGRRWNFVLSGQISCMPREKNVKKEKNILSSWRQVVKLVGRQ